MSDINDINSHEHERKNEYERNSAIELSQHTTNESLMHMLETYYHALEVFQEVLIYGYNYANTLLDLFFVYKIEFLKDKKTFENWSLSTKELQNKIYDIRTEYYRYVDIYLQISDMFERTIDLFDEPRDKVLQKTKYEHFLQYFYNVFSDIETIWVQYEYLMGNTLEDDN